MEIDETIQLCSLDNRKMAHASHSAKTIIVEVLMENICSILVLELPSLAEKEELMYNSTHLEMQYIIMAMAFENGLLAEEVFVPPQYSISTYAAVLTTPPPKRYYSFSLLELPGQTLLSDTAGVPPLPWKQRMYRTTMAMIFPTCLMP